MTVKTKLFVALDKKNAEEARDFYKKIRPFYDHFKIGLELFCATGPDFVKELVSDGGQIFLDLKFHDIPNTVAKAVKSVAGLNVGWINVHLSGGENMVRAAVNALKENKGNTKLLGVTVLTSMEDKDLSQVAISNSAAAQVELLAREGKNWGIDGVVCSAQELDLVQKICGKDFITVVPGIRPLDSQRGDQKRIMTPEAAAEAGAHFIVVGRPIVDAADPVWAVKNILEKL